MTLNQYFKYLIMSCQQSQQYVVKDVKAKVIILSVNVGGCKQLITLNHINPDPETCSGSAVKRWTTTELWQRGQVSDLPVMGHNKLISLALKAQYLRIFRNNLNLWQVGPGSAGMVLTVGFVKKVDLKSTLEHRKGVICPN